MKFNLKKLKDETVIVSNTDEEFAGTSLADSPFQIEVRRLTRAEKIDTMQSAVDKEGKFSNGSYSKALFIKSIADVADIIDEDNQPLTEDDGIKEIIWEYGDDVLVERIKAVAQGFNKADDKKKEEPETDSEPMQIGQ